MRHADRSMGRRREAEKPSRYGRRRAGAFATLLALWVVVLATAVVASLQTFAFSEAVTGREALGRVRAYWAARAGIEAVIAVLQRDAEDPDPVNAFALERELAAVSEGVLGSTRYRIAHTREGREVLGPADAHAKLNVNLMTREQLLLVPFMSEDVADAILDWVDSDDDTRPLGAEAGYYASLPLPLQPRNAPLRSLAELELVAGVYPEYVRGEDANLNGLLDVEEDNGDLTYPPDNADGVLDAGWSGILTTASVDDVLTPTGQPRLDLRSASASELVQRTGLDSSQAEAILEYVAGVPTATMRDFILRTPGDLLRRVPGTSPERLREAPPPLSDEQLGRLLDECTIAPASDTGPRPGRLNINTCPADVLQYLPEIDPALADMIILERESRPGGFTSIVDLLAVPAITRRRLAQIYPLLTVRSNVYVVCSRGRDAGTGLEVEMIATVDRSILPAVIRELRVR